MKTFGTLTTDLLQALQDDATIYDAAETAIRLEDAIREVSDYHPYLMREVFKIESRTGTATGTTANKLVDSEAAFVDPDDVGKVIHNTTDKTWADITAVDDANTLSLGTNIMVSGEAYEMYNEDCRSKKEIYIGDITDYVGGKHGVLEDDAHAPEYPLGTKRNVQISGDILTILLDADPNDSSESDADVEVFVWFNKKHRVSQLTDLLGAVDGTPAASAITMDVKDFSGSEIIAEDTLFTIAGISGTYRTTQATTLSSGAGTIYFWPGLAGAPGDGAVITVTSPIGSTLNNRLERLVVGLAAAQCLMSKGLKLLSESNNAIAVLATVSTAIGNMSARVTQAIVDVVTGRTEAAKIPAIIALADTEIDRIPALITSANTEIDKVAALITKAETSLVTMSGEVRQAEADLNTGRALINTIPKGGAGVPTDYMNYAGGDLATARGYVTEAEANLAQARADEALSLAFFNEARADESLASAYLGEARAEAESAVSYFSAGARELSMAATYLSQAGGYVQRISAGLQISRMSGQYRTEGEARLALAYRDLEKGQPVGTKQTYSRI